MDGSTGLTNDCEALLDSKDALEGTSTALSGWIDHAHMPISDWLGVTVDATSMRVTGLDLKGSNLSGTVPSSLGRLDALEMLNLRSNDLTGSIPADIGLADEPDVPEPALERPDGLDTGPERADDADGPVPAE